MFRVTFYNLDVYIICDEINEAIYDEAMPKIYLFIYFWVKWFIQGMGGFIWKKLR